MAETVINFDEIERFGIAAPERATQPLDTPDPVVPDRVPAPPRSKGYVCGQCGSAFWGYSSHHHCPGKSGGNLMQKIWRAYTGIFFNMKKDHSYRW